MSRIAATTPSRVSRSFSSEAAPRLSNGTVGSGTSPRGAFATRSRRSSASDTLVRKRDRRVEYLRGRRARRRASRRSSGSSIAPARSPRARARTRRAGPRCSRSRRVARLVERDRGGREVAAQQTQPDAARGQRGRGPASRRGGQEAERERDRPRARRRPRRHRRPRGRPGMSRRTTSVPIGSVVTTSAPVIGDQPHTTTSSSTDRNSAPTSAPYSARKPAFASPVRGRGPRRGVRSTARTRGSNTATSASAASGAWSRKMLRQLNSSVRKPPSAGPTATPIVPAKPPHADRVRVAAADAGQQRDRADERERGAEALHGAADDQHLERLREAAHQRREREHAEADAGEHVAAHAALDREHAERADDDREVVRGDRPRDADERDVERAVDRGQRQDDDRRVGDRQRDRERNRRDQQACRDARVVMRRPRPGTPRHAARAGTRPRGSA